MWNNYCMTNLRAINDTIYSVLEADSALIAALGGHLKLRYKRGLGSEQTPHIVFHWNQTALADAWPISNGILKFEIWTFNESGEKAELIDQRLKALFHYKVWRIDGLQAFRTWYNRSNPIPMDNDKIHQIQTFFTVRHFDQDQIIIN